MRRRERTDLVCLHKQAEMDLVLENNIQKQRTLTQNNCCGLKFSYFFLPDHWKRLYGSPAVGSVTKGLDVGLCLVSTEEQGRKCRRY